MMRTHTFSGATSREVLQKVKHALGDDALILSNRAVHGGIEVVALCASDARPADAQPVQAPLRLPAQPAPFDSAGASIHETSAAPAVVSAAQTPAALAPLASPAPWSVHPAIRTERSAPLPTTTTAAPTNAAFDGI